MKLHQNELKLPGLAFDRHEEAKAVEAFGRAIALAAEAYMEDPMGSPPIPNWNRVKAATPDIFEMLKTAVEANNR